MYVYVCMYVCIKAVFDVDPKYGLLLVEHAEGVNVEDIRRKTGCEFEVSANLTTF